MKKESNLKKRGNFGSRFGVLVALIGSAVGLGNLWRFPYLIGSNGGAAFILIYIFFVFLLCLPIVCSEFIIGRSSESNAFAAFKILKPGSKWGIAGFLAVLCSTLILGYYCVVGGWSLKYLIESLEHIGHASYQSQLSDVFHTHIAQVWQPLFYMFLFVIFTGSIILGGVQKGIEKFSKIVMPLLFILILGIAIKSITLPGAEKGVDFLFHPDFSKVTWGTVLKAMGQSFFSLSIGCGIIITYGSYVKKDENIPKASLFTAIADMIFALLAGVAIMPAVFSFGISPSEGPGLVFVTLPHIFSQITGGSIIASIFFFVLFIAAITSSIALLEVVVAYVIEEFKITRKSAVIVMISIISFLGIFSSLSIGVWKNAHLFGLNIFDLLDYISANILMPLGGFLVVVFLGWKLDKKFFTARITNEHNLKFKYGIIDAMYYIIKYIAPILIAVIMITGIFG